MNTYSSLRKRNNGSLLAAVSLALCVLLSGSMLFSRLLAFSAADTRHYIPLTESGGITAVSVGQRDALSFRQVPAYALGQPTLLAASPFLSTSWFRTYDENTVWQGETDIEIFRVSYENGGGQTTVSSGSGENVLAPGTANTYSFALENTGSHNVKYEMSMEAFFTDGTHVIPVQARVCDHQGNYFAGTADSYVDVMELNTVSDAGRLRPGYIMPYTLQWQWPFETDDAYDTMLGDLAVEEDITLTIVIRTLASYVPEADGGIPKTGDTTPIGLLATIMVCSAGGLLFLLLPRRRKGEEHGNA